MTRNTYLQTIHGIVQVQDRLSSKENMKYRNEILSGDLVRMAGRLARGE